MATKKTKKSIATKILDEVLKPKQEVEQPKKPTRRRAARKAAAEPGTYVVIDYPQPGEVVSGLIYSVRIGASGSGYVELSIDGGEWQPCRQSEGYWWYDWGYYTPGTHKLVARLQSFEGKTIMKSPVVKVEVV